MKSLKFLLFAGTVVCFSFSLNSCNGTQTKKDSVKMHHSEDAGKEYTSAYVCPMHCEGSGSEDPGECPVCGMDYVQKEEHYKDGHSH